MKQLENILNLLLKISIQHHAGSTFGLTFVLSHWFCHFHLFAVSSGFHILIKFQSKKRKTKTIAIKVCFVDLAPDKSTHFKSQKETLESKTEEKKV